MKSLLENRGRYNTTCPYKLSFKQGYIPVMNLEFVEEAVYYNCLLLLSR